jgi:hypothetical protein
MVNLSHYISESQPIIPVSGPISSQMGKRYLKDYPESDKIYTEHGTIEVKDSSGYILVVGNAIKDLLVLEDPSETRLQQLARKYAFGRRDPENYFLYKQIVAEFGEKEASTAVFAAFAEARALFSEEARIWADKVIEIIKLSTLLNKEIDKINRQWDMVSHAGPDGVRRLTGPDGVRRLNQRLTLFEVFKYGKLMLSDYLEKNHPTVLGKLKVVLVVIPFFLLVVLAAIFLAFPLLNDTRKVKH